MSLFEKGSVYEQPSIYNQGGGGGGGGGTPDGYVFYTKIIFNGGTDFSANQKRALLKDILYDDVIYFNYAFTTNAGNNNSYLFDLNFQASNGDSSFRRVGHIKKSSGTKWFYINEFTSTTTERAVDNKLFDVSVKMTSTYAKWATGETVNYNVDNKLYTIVNIGPWNARCEIYSLIIVDSTENILKFHLVPALQTDTGKKGLYDKVSNTFIEAADQTNNTVLFGSIV